MSDYDVAKCEREVEKLQRESDHIGDANEMADHAELEREAQRDCTRTFECAECATLKETGFDSVHELFQAWNTLDDKIAELEEESRKFYNADGTFEILEPDVVVERRKKAAKRIAELERQVLWAANDALEYTKRIAKLEALAPKEVTP